MTSDSHKSQLVSFLKKWGISLLLLPYIALTLHMIYRALRFNIFFAVNYSYPFPVNVIHIFVDNFLLIVHEAGHTFFGLLGMRFVTILGGSLFQIVLPLLIVGFCWLNRYRGGMQFSLFLLGYSWLDVAAYAADGGARQLPLIGGLSDSHHDWFNLLNRLNALEYDMTVAVIFTSLGVLCYGLSVLWPMFYRHYEQIALDLEL